MDKRYSKCDIGFGSMGHGVYSFDINVMQVYNPNKKVKTYELKLKPDELDEMINQLIELQKRISSFRDNEQTLKIWYTDCQ